MDPIFLIPVAIFLFVGGLAFAIGRSTGGRSVAIGTGVLAAVGGLLMLAASQASGYDGIGYAIAAVFGAGPAVAGYLIGGLWGWQSGCRADDATPL